MTPREKNPLQVQGMRVKIARIKSRLTQQQLAEQTEGLLTQQMISQIENGVRELKVSEAAQLSKAMDVPIEYLAGSA